MSSILELLGLVVIGYGVCRLVMLLLADLTESYELRNVMEGRTEAPWEPRTVRIVREVFDQDAE